MDPQAKAVRAGSDRRSLLFELLPFMDGLSVSLGAAVVQARSVIDEVIEYCDHRRLHSSLFLLRPVDYYRGNPKAVLAERHLKLATARESRRAGRESQAATTAALVSGKSDRH